MLGAPEVRARPLSLLTSTDRIAFTLARVMAQELRDVGLDVEVVPLDFGLFMHRLAAGDFELAALQMPELTEPNVLRWFFHSGFIPSAERPSAGANRAHYRSKDVDAWLDLAAAELDPGKRAALYDLVARRLRGRHAGRPALSHGPDRRRFAACKRVRAERRGAMAERGPASLAP